MNGDRAAHDEREARIPVAEEVEKADHLRRQGHPREHQPDAEDRARAERGERLIPALP